MPFIRAEIKEDRKYRNLVENYGDKEKKKLKTEGDSVSRSGYLRRWKTCLRHLKLGVSWHPHDRRQKDGKPAKH
ncbi:MAG: hypothetical protein ACNYVW_10640 [Methanosarcinales archaeon]